MHARTTVVLVVLGVAGAPGAIACGGDARESSAMPQDVPVPMAGGAAPTVTQPDPSPPSTSAATAPTDVVIPTDDRPALASSVMARPIAGGTLILNAAGDTAIAADPERDRISIVQVYWEELTHTIELAPGDQPWRMVEDAAGLVHVVLRGANQIATIDPVKGTLLERRDVCREPRGIAYDAASQLLHVACATGRLWTLPLDGGAPVRDLWLAPDLRDVLVDGTRLWVTRFKSAELLELDASGHVVSTRTPNSILSSRGIRATAVETPRFTPNGAFRTVLAEDGSVVMVHQRALTDPIKIDPGMPASLNGYYGGTCGGIVESAVTVFRADGSRVISGALQGALAVDVAVGAGWASVVFAGAPDQTAPRVGSASSIASITGVVTRGALHQVLSTEVVEPDDEPTVTCEAGGAFATQGQSVAVATTANGSLVVVQSREPAQIEIMAKPGGTTNAVVSLGGPSVLDTGHELFHRSPDGGVTCASCHLEGGDDGHVWTFDPLGPRRTQSLQAGLTGTEPFHWTGDIPDLAALLEEVMVVRMGGVHQSTERVASLERFLSTTHPPAPIVKPTSSAAQRGRALFESKDVGCTECHASAALTNNRNVWVGTGLALQVPSLRGVGYRAPFLHDGCAPTLAERFDPACGGGDRHGHTSDLTQAEVGDLVAYLESL